METFKAFFSYAHHDFDTDPELVEALTVKLEKRVSGKLTDATLEIWRDNHEIRLGHLWDKRIGDAVEAAKIFIVLLTPKWIESDYCRKEHQLFLPVEPPDGEYIAVLLAKDLETQKKHFSGEQQASYDKLAARQYKTLLAENFLALSQDERTLAIEKIADDIAGMIERLRLKKPAVASAAAKPAPAKAGSRVEFTGAHDFTRVDFLSLAMVEVAPQAGPATRAIYAQVGFVERLYVSSDKAILEFGVRQAYFTVQDGGRGKVSPNQALPRPKDRSVEFTPLRGALPGTVTIGITAAPGRALGELVLPPAEGENLLSHVAYLAEGGGVDDVKADLSVSFCPHGLFIQGEDARKPSAKLKTKIAAVMAALLDKEASLPGTGLLRRAVPVSERVKRV